MEIKRYNKFGQACYFEKGYCGSCSHYNFEREDDTNKCDKYGRYFWPNDSCKNNYEEYGGSSSGCFLTSACCEFMNLDDNCPELTLLRRYRDTELVNLKGGRKLIDEYYSIAPGIVEKIHDLPKVKEHFILSKIYEKITTICEELEHDHCPYHIMNEYRDMVRNVLVNEVRDGEI